MHKLLRAFTLLLTLCLVLPLFCACATEQVKTQDEPALREGAIRLAANRESAYRIVIGEDASEDIRKTAQEFCDYFQKISGAALSIVTDDTPATKTEVVIGKTNRSIDDAAPYDTLGNEGYTYLGDGGSVLLTGNTDRSVAYAVYAFLEDRLDVRYWTPDFESVPEKNVVDIAKTFSVSETPTFWYRDTGTVGHSDPVWMVKMRLNSRQSLGSENYRKTPFVGGGEGYADWFVHTIGKLAEMPKNEGGDYFNVQPCLTDETVYQTVLKNVRKWLEEYPDATIVSISQNDGTQESSMCSCDNCTALYEAYGNVQSAKWIWFVSKIANELRDEYPNVRFETLSYNFTTMAPTGLEIPDNVIVRCVSSFCCLNHNYKDCANEHGTAQQKKSSLFDKTATEWTELCDNVFIWDYGTLFHNHWAPLTNFDTLRQNMNYYAKKGVKGVYLQGGDQNDSFGELRSYLFCKLLWNPEMDEDSFQKLMTEFMDGYYGKGSSEPLTEYIELMNRSVEDQHFHLYAILFQDYHTLSVYEDEEGTHLDTASLIEPMRALFDRAEDCAETDEEKAHLRKARIQIKTYELLALFELEETYENACFDLEYRRALGKELHEDVLACKMTHFSEGSSIPENANYDYPPDQWNHE